jgi:precorrin-3B C17-methyltransferase
MAGLVFEMAKEAKYPCTIEIIPGLAAINSCAARLGAPLMHDFAAISLSDLLTPWELIEKRLEAAADADFVTAIYNPRSKRRTEQIVRAREIFLTHRDPKTPVGIVTAATRENEKIVITTLEDMLNSEIGMQSTVIIGNSQTFTWKDLMITPRGYGEKYQL